MRYIAECVQLGWSTLDRLEITFELPNSYLLIFVLEYMSIYFQPVQMDIPI